MHEKDAQSQKKRGKHTGWRAPLPSVLVLVIHAALILLVLLLLLIFGV